MGVARPWHAGVLYNRDPRFAHLLMALLKREEGLVVGDNEPYSVTDASDYTIPVHGERRGLHHVAIEIRQDLIADDKGQRSVGCAARALAAAGVSGVGGSRGAQACVTDAAKVTGQGWRWLCGKGNYDGMIVGCIGSH